MSDEFNLTEEDIVLSTSDTEKYRSALAFLAESDSFKIFQTIIRKQIQARKDRIIGMPIYDEKTMAERNLLVGEVTGMETVMLLPAKALEAIKLEQAINPKKDKENSNGDK